MADFLLEHYNSDRFGGSSPAGDAWTRSSIVRRLPSFRSKVCFAKPALRYENSGRKANSFGERPVVTVIFPHQAAGIAEEMLLFRGSSFLQESHLAQAT
jgi:hypothetical protein